jgi:hypothetical protein
MVGLLLVLVVMVIAAAAVMVHAELPLELESRSQAKKTYEDSRDHLFGNTFNFMLFPGGSPICTHKERSFYREIRDARDAKNATIVLAKSCTACFPGLKADEDSHDDRIPRLDFQSPVFYMTKFWDASGRITFDAGSECSFNSTFSIQGGGVLCWPLCPLTLPSVEQVKACESPDNHDSLSKEFIEGCLKNTDDCPNCDRLQGSMSRNLGEVAKHKILPELKIYDPSELSRDESPVWSQGRRSIISAAELYITYKKDFDSLSLPGKLNFDWVGSVFFSTTILTTIGYGNFAPQQPITRLLLSIFSIPGIGIFGYFLAQLAGQILILVAWLRVYVVERLACSGTTKRLANRCEFGDAAAILRQYDVDKSGAISVEELVPAVIHAEVEDLGVDFKRPKDGPQRLKQRRAEILAEVKELYIEHLMGIALNAEAKSWGGSESPDLSLDLTQSWSASPIISAEKTAEVEAGTAEVDLLTAHVILQQMTRQRRDELRTQSASQSLWLLLFMALVVLLGGTVVFRNVHEGWSYCDALYFCVITSTR